VPTIFNLLGPLTNPAGAPFQLLGVGHAELRQTMAQALALLGTRRSAVVSGEGGLGEVTIAGATFVSEVTQGGAIREHRWTPADFGFKTATSLNELVVENATQSAALIQRVLAGELGPARDIVAANTAAALWIAGKAQTLLEGAATAQQAIDRGAARKLLDRLIDFTNGSPSSNITQA
jgi:anthranilate phosphoribosyltransferase